MPVHVLTGRSGMGKSAFLIRSLRWLVFNQPSGDRFRRWGSDITQVSAYFDDTTGWLWRLHVQNFQCHRDVDVVFTYPEPDQWTRVSRIRSNRTNHYEMQVCEEGGMGDTIVYKIGSDRRVPDPISSYLNLSPINFQFQHDPIYLLGLNRTPFELARQMNALAGMGDMDRVMSRINGEVKRINDERKKWDGEVERLDREMEKYVRIPDLEASVSALELFEGERDEARRKGNEIRGMVEEVVERDRELGKYDGIGELEKVVGELSGSVQATSELRSRISSIRSLISTYHSHTLPPPFTSLPSLSSSLPTSLPDTRPTRDKASEIRKLIADYRKLDREWEAASKELGVVDDKFHSLMPEVCPLCDNPIKPDGKENLDGKRD